MNRLGQTQRQRRAAVGKPHDRATPNPLAMLRTLLEDRFKLRVHRESGESRISRSGSWTANGNYIRI